MATTEVPLLTQPDVKEFIDDMSTWSHEQTLDERIALATSRLLDEKGSFVVPKRTAAQVDQIQRFVNGVVQQQQETPGVLYVFGSPGVGKTSAVRYCCNQAAQSNDEVTVCSYNAAQASASTGTLTQGIISLVTETLGVSPNTTLPKLLDRFKAGRSRTLMLVLDEIDHLVPTNGGNTRNGDALSTLFEYAKSPEYSFGIIGISNAVENQVVQRLTGLGMVSVACTVLIHTTHVILHTYSSFSLTIRLGLPRTMK